MKEKQDVSDKEFIDYIFSQDRKKKIDMNQPTFRRRECGCVMIHFGIDNGLKSPSAGFHTISDESKRMWLQSRITKFVPSHLGSRINYGMVQNYLLNQEWVKELIEK